MATTAETWMMKSGWVAWWRSIYLKMNGIKRSSLEIGLILITWFWNLSSLLLSTPLTTPVNCECDISYIIDQECTIHGPKRQNRIPHCFNHIDNKTLKITMHKIKFLLNLLSDALRRKKRQKWIMNLRLGLLASCCFKLE